MKEFEYEATCLYCKFFECDLICESFNFLEKYPCKIYKKLCLPNDKICAAFELKSGMHTSLSYPKN